MAASADHGTLYHLVQQELWQNSKSSGQPYYPPSYEAVSAGGEPRTGRRLPVCGGAGEALRVARVRRLCVTQAPGAASGCAHQRHHHAAKHPHTHTHTHTPPAPPPTSASTLARTQDGFIHLTKDPSLLLGVANMFYKTVPGPFLVLALDSSKLSSKARAVAAAAGAVGRRSRVSCLGCRATRPARRPPSKHSVCPTRLRAQVVFEAAAPVGDQPPAAGVAEQLFPHLVGGTLRSWPCCLRAAVAPCRCRCGTSVD
jgi:uncharacterized protein (DUF952 family)